MRNFGFPLFGLFCLLVFIPGKDRHMLPLNPKQFMESRWTGTLTLEENFTGLTGNSTRKVTVSFINVLPTLYRDDATPYLDFTDDKGSGTVIYHGEAYAGGKKIAVTDCDGSGKSQLNIVALDLAANTYDIHAIGPACNGTTVSFLDGKTEPYGPEFTDIIVSNQRLATMNVLAGTKSEQIDLGGDLGKITRTISWHLERDNEDVQLIVKPEDYDNWKPEPGRDENTVGKIMTINLKLQTRNGQQPLMKAHAFELFLSNTSKEPGITINFPINPGTPKPDLRLLLPSTAQSDESGGQFLRINCQGSCLTATARIGAYDGGGWTTLKAVAILEDSTRVIGSLLVPGGEQEIRIPKRPIDSKIAEAWRSQYNDPPDLLDEEESDANTNNGDGLTAYEEYRGVISKGRYKKLSPDKKELGVRVLSAQETFFSEGMNWFKNASDIDVVCFFEQEIDGTSRRLNANFTYGHNFDQCALKLEKKHLPFGVVGQAFNYGGPRTTTLVGIDWPQMQAFYGFFTIQASPARLKYTLNELLANTVAHELSHGVDVKHHGEQSNEPDPQTATAYSQPPYRIFKSNGTEITTRPFTLEDIGTAGSQQSGDLSCIIAYNPYYKWAYTVGADGANIFNEVPLLPMGRNMCRSRDGTGINHSVIYFGDARRGRGFCLSQIDLKQ